MLSGIKMSKGKKRKAEDSSVDRPAANEKKKYGLQMMGDNTKTETFGKAEIQLDNDWINRSKMLHDNKNTNTNNTSRNTEDNAAAAEEEMRREMMSNISGFSSSPAPLPPPSTTSSTSASKTSSNTSNLDAAEALRRELSGLGQSHVGGEPAAAVAASLSSRPPAQPPAVVLSSLPAHTFEREDMKFGSRRGKKLSSHQSDYKDGFSRGADGAANNGAPTLQELIDEERSSSSKGMDEIYARNIARVGSRYKGNDVGGRGDDTNAGFDEEDQIDMTMYQSQSERLTSKANYDRERSRQISEHLKQTKATDKCSWWLQSSKFRSHLLLALGEHVSLVMIPSHQALCKFHLALVPVQHADAMTACDNEVWDEVARFKTYLRKAFKKMKKRPLYLETVLETKSFHQTRIDVVPVGKHAEQDAHLHFKSALTEQAEEWGTHNKVIDTKSKGGVRYSVPKGFSYFSVDWHDGGYASIIEDNTERQWVNWGLDVCGSMIGADPIKMNKKKFDEGIDRSLVKEFEGVWKDFDWTKTEMETNTNTKTKTKTKERQK